MAAFLIGGFAYLIAHAIVYALRHGSDQAQSFTLGLLAIPALAVCGVLVMVFLESRGHLR